mmetsp:Transcript_69078/g.179456  ORF Transcript_69078/g.179456 Transcript_69078/m.179456 type:complete len:506 (-) Transcript_69078:139-1656(-)
MASAAPLVSAASECTAADASSSTEASTAAPPAAAAPFWTPQPFSPIQGSGSPSCGGGGDGAADRDSGAAGIASVDEPRTSRSLANRACGPMTANGLRHATLTLTSTALGAGVLSLGYVMRLSGLALGVGMLMTGCFLSFISIKILMEMTVKTGKDTYAGLFAHCAGPRAGPILDFLLFFYGAGACMGYLVLIGDFVPALVAFAAPRAPAWCASRELAICVAAAAVLPLAAQRDVSALRWVSPVSIFGLVYMAAIVTAQAPALFAAHAESAAGGGSAPSSASSVAVATLDLHVMESFALCIFAYNCHMNVIPVAASMVMPTKARITKVSARVNGLQLLFYCLVGVSGYLSFLAETPQDILQGYPSGNWLVAGGRLMLSCTMLVAIPLNMVPTVRCFMQMVEYVRGSEATEPDAVRSVVPRIALTTVCIVCQALLAIRVPGIADIMSILGATVATAMMLAIPAYCMGKVMPITRRNRALQAALWLFALVSFASVPVKVLRMLHLIPA